MDLDETIGSLRDPLNQGPGPRSKGDQELLDLCMDCTKKADELLTEFQKIQSNTQGGLRQAFRNGIKAVRKKEYFKKSQKELESFRKILLTRLLIRLDGRSVEQRQDFSTLGQVVQDLVVARNQGPKAIEQLLNNNAQLLRDHIDHCFDREAQLSRRSKLERQFVDSLFFPDIYAREEQISDQHQGTCQWIFSSADCCHDPSTHSWPSFMNWLENENGFYWMHGKPGSGKSTLMNYIIHDSKTDDALTTWANGSTVLRPSFFFWSSGSEFQKTSAGLLRSLIYQIASKRGDLIPILTNADAHFQKAASDPSRSVQIPTWTVR